jgi:hypothetical protein
MAVMIQTQAGFVPGTPQRLYEGDFVNSLWQDYDVAPDGRFITVRADRPNEALPQLTIVHDDVADRNHRELLASPPSTSSRPLQAAHHGE